MASEQHTPFVAALMLLVGCGTVVDGDDAISEPDRADVGPIARSPRDGDDEFSIPRDVWARLDVLANDRRTAQQATVQIVDAPTRGVVVVEDDGVCRYRSDWHVHGDDWFTYAVTEGGIERARHRVDIEVRDEVWLALGGRAYPLGRRRRWPMGCGRTTAGRAHPWVLDRYG
jgi:hypothetical protein